MSCESISSVASVIQSNLHHLINERCPYLKEEYKDFEYPNLMPYFKILIDIINKNPTVTKVKFDDLYNEDDANIVKDSHIIINSLEGFFGIPGLYGGFTLEFFKQIDKKPIQIINIAEMCQCNVCLSTREQQLLEPSDIDLEEFKKWYYVPSSWCRIAGGSGQKHKITTEGYVLIDKGFI